MASSSTIARSEAHSCTARRELNSVSAMQRMLCRERELANRFEGFFSMLVFELSDAPSRMAAAAHLAEILGRRLRLSDEVGWLDPQHTQLGVVMHRTGAAEAWNVADDVLAAFRSDLPAPSCRVRYYPSDPSMGHDRPLDSVPGADGTARPVEAMEALYTLKTPLAKRFLDIVAAGIGLLLLTPLFLLVALAIKVNSRGPVFYSQPRRGWGGRRFVIHKFRSMTTDAEQKHRWLMMFNEQDGPAFKMKNDPRITAVGRFLRRTNLDELPQLWNVLRGDMSLVGPRPLVCPEADSCAVWQRQRLDVVPGITCIWQVHGLRDNFDDWIRLDLRYVRLRSLRLDIKLMLETVPVMIFGRPAGC